MTMKSTKTKTPTKYKLHDVMINVDTKPEPYTEIEILEGPWEGVRYQYGEVAFHEICAFQQSRGQLNIRLQYETKFVPETSQPCEGSEFTAVIGDILVDIMSHHA